MRIENYRRHRVPWLAVLIVLLWVLVGALIMGATLVSFVPRCREFDRQMESMQEQMDSIKQGWEDLRP